MTNLLRLITWEFEENWRLPYLEVIAAIIIYFTLTTLPPYIVEPYTQISLYFRTAYSFWLLLFQIIFVAVFFSRSFADQIEKREILTLFAHPIKRSTIFTAKFLTNTLIIFLIFAIPTFAQGLLMNISPLNPAIYICLLTIFIAILFYSAIALACAVLTKSTWATIILPTVTLFALAFASPKYVSYNYLSTLTGMQTIFQYLVNAIIPDHLALGQPTLQEFLGALLFPVITGLILIVISFIHFRKMEVD
jgi:ABC-type transport system involved in multi-copper enzyme maturation permease subunit